MKFKLSNFADMSNEMKLAYFMQRLDEAPAFADYIRDLMDAFLKTFGFIKGYRSVYYHLPGQQLCVKLHSSGMSIHNGNKPNDDMHMFWFNKMEREDLKVFLKAIYDGEVDFYKIDLRLKMHAVEQTFDVLPG